jgi:hypothetical protein
MGRVEWTMLYLFVALKIPLLVLFWLIYWAVKQEPELEDTGDDGGQRRARPHPPPRLPRAPRRGPHGDQLPEPPPRVRPVSARARQLER